MKTARGAWGLVAFAGLACATACTTAKSPFPDSGGVLARIVYSGTGTQASAELRPQAVSFELTKASMTVPDQPSDYSFLSSPTCTVFAGSTGIADFAAQCGGSGLTLQVGGARTVTFHLAVSRMEVRLASRPSLPDVEDFDGDGVPNGQDNCKIVPNPPSDCDDDPTTAAKQCDINLDGVGDACSDKDSVNNPTIPDQDGDLVRDSLDNCLWVANPLVPPDTTQLDTDRDNIGDACQRNTPVVIPGGGAAVDCAAGFTLADQQLALYNIDFTDAVSCSPAFTSCSLDPAKVKIYKNGDIAANGTACTVVP